MNLFKFKSIRTRLTILFLLIALSPLAIVLTITYFQRADTIESRTIVKLTAIRDLKVQQLNNWLDERVGDMHVMAGDHEIRDIENILGKKEKSVEDIKKTETARDLINRNLRNYDDYEEILIIDSNTGLVELSTNPEFIGENKSRNSYFSVPLETGEVYIKDIYYSNTTKRAEMVFSIPILCLEHNTHIIGIFAARINLDASLYKLLQNRVGLGNTGETLIVNKKGIALSELRWHDNAPLNLKIEAEPAVNAASGMTGIAITNDYRGERVLAAYTFIPQTNWGFVCKQDMKELNSPIVEMIWNFIIMFILTSLGTFIIARIFSISISKPILEMDLIAQKIKDGDYSARNLVNSSDELGSLADSINITVDKLSLVISTQKVVRDISELMLSENDARKFFHTTLSALSEQTGTQMAATYLLSDDKKSFEHFESIGLDEGAKQSFAADSFEGEFGAALSTRKVQHIRNIPENTRFTFQTVSGKFIPHEIITIPIHANKEVIAVISLASVNKYNDQSNQLIDNILPTLSSRIEGILAYRRIMEFSEKLGQQNRELESQQTELSSQSAELMEQNAELEMQKVQLGEASKLKTNFLSNMSHELRTPLNSVIALSGVLNRHLASKIPDEEYSYIEIIERNGKHLLNLINDILDISRIEAGSEEVEITKFNTNNLIAELVTMISPQAQEKNIELLHKEGNSELFISSDANKCQHILQNLISNAVKFTDKGKVEVTAVLSKKNILITVTDTGIGISESHIPHIFDEFRQADGSMSRRFGGTGLGLAIAKKYANLLGGTLSVKSTNGKGSEFTLILPLQYSTENQISKAETNGRFSNSIIKAPHKPTTASSVGTILIVDDSEPSIIQMKDFLEESGYDILLAHEGGEALEIIAQTIPDAMILDLMMPNIDGFEVLKTLRDNESTAYVPVLILTAKHINKEELQFLKRNNIHQLIQKGDVNRSELLNAVATMLSPQTAETAKPPLELQIIEGKPLVLVVEDNPDNMTTAKAILSDNFTVLEATDGKIAIEMAKQHTPHLILMDIDLPVMNGIEAFKAIRSNARLLHIPVIALTASAMVSDRETILANGFDGYLVKPIDETVFFKEINETLYGK